MWISTTETAVEAMHVVFLDLIEVQILQLLNLDPALTSRPPYLSPDWSLQSHDIRNLAVLYLILLFQQWKSNTCTNLGVHCHLHPCKVVEARRVAFLNLIHVQILQLANLLWDLLIYLLNLFNHIAVKI